MATIQNQYDGILDTLTEARIQKGYTQTEMGELIHLSQNAYYKLEKGYTRLDVHRLIEIGFLLELDLKDLF